MTLDKCSWISAIEEILHDNSQFSKLDIPAGKEINHIINFEKRINSELKLLENKEIIDKCYYKSINPVGFRPGILNGLGKNHKETRNGLLHHISALFFQLLEHLPSKVFTAVCNTFNS